MRFRKFALLVVACMAVVAVAANAAQAATQWTLSGKTALAEETVKLSKKSENLTLTGKTSGGLEVELTATGIGCASGATCKIFGAGESSGTLTFSGVTVMKPANCTVVGGAVTTKALKDKLKMVGSTVYDMFEPSSGTTFTEFEFGGSLCSVAELVVPITGTAAGQSANATEVLASNQPLSFSAAAQTAAGAALKVGGGAATITGEVNNELAGTHKGEAFGAME